MALVVIEPRRVLIATLVGVGKRTARLREQAVVETLLQLPRLTKPTGTSLSGHLVTYLSYLGLRRSPFPLRAASTWAVDPPFSHDSPAPADRSPGRRRGPSVPRRPRLPRPVQPSICPADGQFRARSATLERPNPSAVQASRTPPAHMPPARFNRKGAARSRRSPTGTPSTLDGLGRLAQRESAAFTRQRPQVRNLQRPQEGASATCASAAPERPPSRP
jgi:hypothetical protein